MRLVEGEDNAVWLIDQLLKGLLKGLVRVMGLWGVIGAGRSLSSTKTMVSRWPYALPTLRAGLVGVCLKVELSNPLSILTLSQGHELPPPPTPSSIEFFRI